jgi:predicted ArsR family transcriptional regulator
MLRRPRSTQITSVAALDDPVRRAVFDFVSRSPSAVSRDAAAEELGLSRRVAALHLDRLAEVGLLVVEFRRLHERTGPGAGRPSKLYRRAFDEVLVSVPARQYELIAELFVGAVSESLEAGADLEDVLGRKAYQAGATLGGGGADVFATLEELGYEPQWTDDGREFFLRNCPFHRVAREHTDLVCGLNLKLLRGLVDAQPKPYALRLDPAPTLCCVRIEVSGQNPRSRRSVRP